MSCFTTHWHPQTSPSKQWGVQMIKTLLLLQITVWGHVSGENRSHQSQDYGQETFHHQNRPGWWHNSEAEELCGRWGGCHQRYCQQREGLEDQDNHSPEHWKGQSSVSHTWSLLGQTAQVDKIAIFFPVKTHNCHFIVHTNQQTFSRKLQAGILEDKQWASSKLAFH